MTTMHGQFQCVPMSKCCLPSNQSFIFSVGSKKWISKLADIQSLQQLAFQYCSWYLFHWILSPDFEILLQYPSGPCYTVFWSGLFIVISASPYSTSLVCMDLLYSNSPQFNCSQSQSFGHLHACSLPSLSENNDTSSIHGSRSI